jgi:hypothetical protein
MDTTGKQQAGRNARQRIGLATFGVILAVVLLAKLFYNGWLDPRTSLELDGQPAVVFFTLSRGCECQMVVVQAAEAQLANWDTPVETGLEVIKLDFDRRSNLAHRFRVVRAPALVLVDAAGEVVWKQDVGLSDEAPLDLASAEAHLRQLSEGRSIP